MIRNKYDYSLNINYDLLLGSDWAGVLEDTLLDTDYMENLMLFLHESYKFNNIFPAKKNIFKTFKKTEFSKIRVVILGAEPYTDGKGIGIPLGNIDKYGTRFSPELVSFNNGIERAFYNGFRMYNDPTLEHLSAQGVLLLDCALTSKLGEKFAHIVYWKNFIRQVLHTICDWHPATIFIFMGKKAKEYEAFVKDTGYKFYCDHPSESVENKESWDASVLKSANKILTSLNGEKSQIIW